MFHWLVSLALCLFAVDAAMGAPYPKDGLLTEWVQPGGKLLKLRILGDEFYGRTTTTDGYTVVFAAADQTYYYAKTGTDGESLVASDVKADQPPPPDLAKNLREPTPTVAAVRAANIRKFAPERAAKWAARVKAVQVQRARAAGLAPASDATAPAPTDGAPDSGAPGPPVTGSKVGLVILVRFSDNTFPTTQAKMTNYCNKIGYTDDGNTGSIRDYFYDQSNGQLTFTQLVTTIVTLPFTRSYYNYYNYPFSMTLRPCEDAGNMMVEDAVAILQANNFNFSSLTLDPGKNVIATSLLFAGDDSGVWAQGLWPHSSSVFPINVGTPASPRFISGYQCSNVPNSAPAIGTVCHELGHLLLDYPDFYDTDASDGDSEGVGEHCLMGSGNYRNSGKTPAPIDLYLKDFSGWANITDLTPTQGVDATLTSTGNLGYRIRKPGSSTEYFLLENRGTGDKWANYCPDKGIMIWHVDEAVTTDNQRQQRTTAQHYQLSLEQADGRFDLENNLNRGDSTDLFDLADGLFNNTTTPDSKWWAGTASDITLAVLSSPGPSMNVHFGVGTPIITTTSPLPPGVRGEAYNLTLSVTGGSAPYAWSLTSGSLPSGLSLSATGVISGTPNTVTTASFTVKVTGNNNLFSTKVFSLTIGPSLSDAVDQPALVFTTSGSQPWAPQTTISHDGLDAAQCGTITHDQISVMQTTVTGPGMFSFWWKVSSESDCDYLTFYIDDVRQSGAISGAVDWQPASYTLRAGSHTLKWIYSKDDTISSGSDCGWVDLLTLPAVTPNPYTYTAVDGKITITGYNGAGGALIIPGTIDNLPVTGIGGWAFADCANLTSVALPNSITGIGDAAFAACTGLTQVTIPDSVTSIGASAFASCTSLTRVSLPNNLAGIGNAAFSRCTSLTQVTIPDLVTSIGDLAFAYCTSLAGASFTGNAPSIGADVFGAAAGGFTVYCHNDKLGFSTPSWYGYTTVSMDSSLALWVTSGSFDGITMTSATLNGTVNQGALAGAARFEYGATAAYGNTADAMISPPYGTSEPTVSTSISGLLAGMTYHYRLTATRGGVTITGDDMTFSTAAAEPFTYNTLPNGTLAITGYSGSGGALVIPSAIDGKTVSAIGDAAFQSCPGLNRVTLPASVTSIGISAFASCASLTRVTIPAGVTSIGDGAFSSCTSLASASFTGNAPAMGMSVFDATSGGFTVYYTQASAGFTSPTWMGYPAASLNPWLPPMVAAGAASAVTASSATLQGTVNPNNLASTARFEYGLTDAYGDIVDLTLAPDNDASAQPVSASLGGLQPATTYHYRLAATNGIGTTHGADMTFVTGADVPYTYALSNGLITITGYTGSGGVLVMPSAIGGKIITGIGNWAFYSNTNPTSITLPAGITSIGDQAFHSCTSLASVTIPASVTSIGTEAFYNCGSLTSITIPANITSIGDRAFSYCPNLARALFMGDAPLLGSSVFDYSGSGGDGFTLYFHTDKSGFSSPYCWGYAAVGIDPVVLPAGYAAWASGYFPNEISPSIIGTTADPDHDGVGNAVEMVLGGNPAATMDAALLPTMQRVKDPGGTVPAGEYLVFTFRRTDDSLAAGTASGVEYCMDLSGPWTQAVDGADGVLVDESNDYYAPGIDRVRTYIPHGAQTRVFARLRVLMP